MHFDASKSLAEIGLRPSASTNSLADAVCWLRESGLLPARRTPEERRTSRNAIDLDRRLSFSPGFRRYTLEMLSRVTIGASSRSYPGPAPSRRIPETGV